MAQQKQRVYDDLVTHFKFSVDSSEPLRQKIWSDVNIMFKNANHYQDNKSFIKEKAAIKRKEKKQDQVPLMLGAVLFSLSIALGITRKPHLLLRGSRK